MEAAWFLRDLILAGPYRIHTVPTDRGCDAPCSGCAAALSGGSHSDAPPQAPACSPRRRRSDGLPATDGRTVQIERMNRTLKDATVKRHHYDSDDQLKAHPQLCVDAYGHAWRLKALRGLTPYEFICQARTKEPKRFRLAPSHLIPGPFN